MKSAKKQNTIRILAVAAIVMLGATGAQAAAYTWDGWGASFSAWQTAANWVGGSAPTAVNETTDILIGATFASANATYDHVIQLGQANRTVRSITFNNQLNSVPDAQYIFYLDEIQATPINRVLYLDGNAGSATITVNSDVTKNIRFGRANATAAFGRMELTDTLTVNQNSTSATLGFARRIAGAGGLIKNGDGTLWIGYLINSTTHSGSHDYTGDTTINAGTLQIYSGVSLGGTTNITVNANGNLTKDGGLTILSHQKLGGDGKVTGNLTFDAGADFQFSVSETLTIDAGVVDLGTMGVANLVGLDSSVALGTYTLMDGINGTTFDMDSMANVGEINKYAIGGGKSAYFQAGSLQLVVIPEPGTLGLLFAAFAGMALLRTWRKR